MSNPIKCGCEIRQQAFLYGAKSDADLMGGECIVGELVEALEGIMAEFDSGKLVRDISNDSQPNWSLEMMRLLQTLAKAQAAIAKARGGAA